MHNVLVLNATYQPLNVTSARRALKMIYLNKAEVIKNNGATIRTPQLVFTVPSIIRLFNYILIPHREIPLTRKYIHQRDGYTCQYCGKRETKHMTIDHIIPRSRGGKAAWENLVCACRQCNTKKKNRTLKDANMKLLKMPEKPRFRHPMFFNLHNMPSDWLPFLKMES